MDPFASSAYTVPLYPRPIPMDEAKDIFASESTSSDELESLPLRTPSPVLKNRKITCLNDKPCPPINLPQVDKPKMFYTYCNPPCHNFCCRMGRSLRALADKITTYVLAFIAMVAVFFFGWCPATSRMA